MHRVGVEHDEPLKFGIAMDSMAYIRLILHSTIPHDTVFIFNVAFPSYIASTID